MIVASTGRFWPIAGSRDRRDDPQVTSSVARSATAIQRSPVLQAMSVSDATKGLAVSGQVTYTVSTPIR